MVLMTIFLSFSRATKAGGCQAAESADSSVLSCWHLDGGSRTERHRPGARAPRSAGAVARAQDRRGWLCLLHIGVSLFALNPTPLISHIARSPAPPSTCLYISAHTHGCAASRPESGTLHRAESSTRGLLRPRAHFFSRSLSSRRHGIAMPGCE